MTRMSLPPILVLDVLRGLTHHHDRVDILVCSVSRGGVGVAAYTPLNVVFLRFIKSHAMSCKYRFIDCMEAEIWQEQNVPNT